MNPTRYNGAMVLGLNGVVIKSHGKATPEAFAQAIKNCSEIVEKDIKPKLCRDRS